MTMRTDQESRSSAERPWVRWRKKTRWPPYALLEERVEEEAAKKLERLERLYHVGQDHIWDGRQVLGELIARHGNPRLPADRKEPALKLLSVLLWGELAAWAISADLAERISDIEAKMAATSQAHDEARHFYVLRDYLRALGEPVPPLGGLGRRLLLGILETDSLVKKLIGMQILVESNALALFSAIASARLEPVLTELLPYYERDEGRHVGLGIQYLPRMLRGLTRVQAAGVAVFQTRCIALLASAGLTMRRDFRALGIDPRKLAEHTVRLQDDIYRQMFPRPETPKDSNSDAADPEVTGGLRNPARSVGPLIVDFIHPPNGVAGASPWHRRALRVWAFGARVFDRALA